jgi:hypothetical protein
MYHDVEIVFLSVQFDFFGSTEMENMTFFFYCTKNHRPCVFVKKAFRTGLGPLAGFRGIWRAMLCFKNKEDLSTFLCGIV